MRTAIVALAIALGSAPLGAQRVTKDAAAKSGCRVDSSAAWFTAQRAWLDESKGGWTDAAFREALVRGANVETPVAMQWGFEIAGGAPAGHADSATVARLKALAAQRGSTWPTKSVVGPAGVRAVWLAAAGDTSIATQVLHRLMEAGPEESFPADVAVMEDRQRLRAGRKQLYATQLARVNGKLAPLPTEDLEHVDLRRDGATLPPLTTSLCLARTRTQ